MINYNTAHSEAVYKYFLKTSNNGTNKKKYKLQIWKNNMWYTNIIAMKDIIIMVKVEERKKLSESLVDTTALAKVAQVSSSINHT